jgi:hypothetical protein
MTMTGNGKVPAEEKKKRGRSTGSQGQQAEETTLVNQELHSVGS